MGKGLADMEFGSPKKEPKNEPKKTDIHAGGERPSAERSNDVKKEITDKKISKVKDEIKAIKEKYEPYTNHVNVALQRDIGKLVNFAGTEFQINTKDLVNLAVIRLLSDLKKDSELLKIYMK